MVIVNKIRNQIHYKLVKTFFDALKLAKLSFDIVIWQHGLSHLIINDKSLLFILKL